MMAPVASVPRCPQPLRGWTMVMLYGHPGGWHEHAGTRGGHRRHRPFGAGVQQILSALMAHPASYVRTSDLVIPAAGRPGQPPP
jgi:hypothetical protein